MRLLNEKKISDNDIYFIETVDEKVIVNANYTGILVLNHQLEVEREIYTLPEMIIGGVVKYGSRLLLFCYDNECMVYIDLHQNICKIIPLENYKTKIFSQEAMWEKEKILLKTFNNEYVNIDFIDLENATISSDTLKNNIQILSKNSVKNNEIKKQEVFHYIEVNEDYIVKISEKYFELEHIITNKTQTCYPDEDYVFLSGKFMRCKEGLMLYILCASKSNCLNNILQAYKVE